MALEPKYHLYGTQGCHLCELAEQLCNQVLATEEYKYLDIVDSPKLVELYSISIPVLERLDNGNTLFWPFNLEQLQEFICGTD
ncbi:glutaredoxin family protein [Thalassotalea aquiviva]|uniref:glutaredoxin family protein n=1 Tax=Thalassotalea aquiviva TaxID=3242415 RepID=UPI003529E8B6